MNSRGPLPQPDSRRGLNGTNGAASEFIQEAVAPPAWLTKRQKDYFVSLLDLQHAAGVGVRQADGEMYAQYVVLVFDFRDADDAEERQKARRVMTAMEDQLVIGERARQRIGIRGKKPAAKGKLEVMLAKKNGTTGGE